MNIALIGYGRMGKEIEQIAATRNIAVKKIFTVENNLRSMAITPAALKGIDVCIDFSVPSAVVGNIIAVAGCGTSIVVGTTGWYDQLKEVEKIVKEKKTGLLYSPNFSLGMNIFHQILNTATHLIDKFDNYDIAIEETHHKGKVDSPSGTALAMGQVVLQNVRRKKAMFHETAHTALRPDQIHVTSTRVGSVVGIHRLILDSESDTIELVHTARNRNGFALGALIAAEWLKGKKGVYTMKDVITSL
jgi:4-hydroxy-tetrahydrodipicolinate reductase